MAGIQTSGATVRSWSLELSRKPLAFFGSNAFTSLRMNCQRRFFRILPTVLLLFAAGCGGTWVDPVSFARRKARGQRGQEERGMKFRNP